MLCSLKYCFRALGKSYTKIGIRTSSKYIQQKQTYFGKDGHYDIIIVGGGATGISLAGAIGILIFITKLTHFIF